MVVASANDTRLIRRANVVSTVPDLEDAARETKDDAELARQTRNVQILTALLRYPLQPKPRFHCVEVSVHERRELRVFLAGACLCLQKEMIRIRQHDDR